MTTSSTESGAPTSAGAQSVIPISRSIARWRSVQRIERTFRGDIEAHDEGILAPTLGAG